MERLPTDREILWTIFEEYRKDYPTKGEVLVPIDMQHVARRLRISDAMLFGRLHHDMGNRLRVRDPADPNLTRASIYEPVAGSMRHVVNFPYLASKLAELEDHHKQQRLSLRLSIIAIVVAATAAVATVGQWVSS